MLASTRSRHSSRGTSLPVDAFEFDAWNQLEYLVTELGIEQISLIVGAPNIELAGPLPKEVQSTRQYAAGIVSAGAAPAAANALVHFLSAPAARDIFKAKGFDVP